MSMYADYIKERGVESIIEIDGVGFITFVYKEDFVYLIDVYVVPEQRRSKVASELALKVFEQARSRGISKAVGSVMPKAANGTQNVKSMIDYGFTISELDNHTIWFTKEI